MNLDRLIEKLHKSHNDRTRGLKTPFDSVPNPDLLIGSLKKLNSMVGNNDLKDSISSQIGYLLTMRQNNPKQKIMLNTILYGPPGVGKTQIGKIMAEIWHNMGYLKKRAAEAKTLKATMSGWTTEDVVMAILLLTIAWSLLGGVVMGAYQRMGPLYFGLMLVFVILTGAILWYYYSGSTSSSSFDYTDKTKDMEIKEEAEDNLIVVVSREDFVDKYVGWTDKKTIKLLNDNLGKVVFIDEAYSLWHGGQDSFGMEALTALNRFMSEHAEEIVVIFAGYKDQMEEGIFAAQPGLMRRCMWQFECKPYTPSELFKIFKKQLIRDGWSLADEDNSRLLFNANYLNFTNFGGDTERLTNYCQMAYSDDNILGVNRGLKEKSISIDQLKRGIGKLDANNIGKGNESKDIVGGKNSAHNSEMKMLKEWMKKLQGK